MHVSRQTIYDYWFRLSKDNVFSLKTPVGEHYMDVTTELEKRTCTARFISFELKCFISDRPRIYQFKIDHASTKIVNHKRNIRRLQLPVPCTVQDDNLSYSLEPFFSRKHVALRK